MTIDSEEYKPMINDMQLYRLSQESMKVMARLSYILSLVCYNSKYEKDINSIGFAIFDSPRDKDLDQDKYSRFLEKVNSLVAGQIILTGSAKDEQLYTKVFSSKDIMPILIETDKL